MVFIDRFDVETSVLVVSHTSAVQDMKDACSDERYCSIISYFMLTLQLSDATLCFRSLNCFSGVDECVCVNIILVKKHNPSINLFHSPNQWRGQRCLHTYSC